MKTLMPGTFVFDDANVTSGRLHLACGVVIPLRETLVWCRRIAENFLVKLCRQFHYSKFKPSCIHATYEQVL